MAVAKTGAGSMGTARLRPALALVLIGILAISSCAIHPRGERAERELARKAYAREELKPLSADASLEEVLNYAYRANADLERLYWEWIAALEAIPQDASPGTNLALSVESMFEEGATSLQRTTLGVGNDPMTNLPWPGKLATAGAKSLESARAAGFRFQAGKLELRAKVLSAYYAYALLAESVRLKQREVSLLTTAASSAEGSFTVSKASAMELLEARNARDLAINDLENLRAQVPSRLADLNALLSREAAAPLELPGELPPARNLPYTDAEILGFVAERNPELEALAHDARANEQAVKLARQQYIPDLGLTLSGDLEGMTKSIMAMITAPVVRREAIEASISQARAELEASRAMRRQAANDLAAQTVLALYDLRSAERQVALLQTTLIPRLAQRVEVARGAYAAGQASLGEVVEAEIMLLKMNLMAAEMRMERETMLAEIERLAAISG
ncbi:MAG TPA: TolC family protein [bacterium]|nr:TolC family protein [bacterium]